MEKNFTCPVCGVNCENLTALKNCIAEHERSEKDNEKKKAEQKIRTLENQNKELIKTIEKNCEELKKLGISASVTYITATEKFEGYSSNSKNPLSNIKLFSDNKDIEKFLNSLFGEY